MNEEQRKNPERFGISASDRIGWSSSTFGLFWVLMLPGSEWVRHFGRGPEPWKAHEFPPKIENSGKI
jgi:hypothetical protein